MDASRQKRRGLWLVAVEVAVAGLFWVLWFLQGDESLIFYLAAFLAVEAAAGIGLFLGWRLVDAKPAEYFSDERVKLLTARAASISSFAANSLVLLCLVLLSGYCTLTGAEELRIDAGFIHTAMLVLIAVQIIVYHLSVRLFQRRDADE